MSIERASRILCSAQSCLDLRHDEWNPRIHMIEDLRSVNPIRHRIDQSTSLYEAISFFSLIIGANLLSNVEASLAMPPVHERTRGVNELCSIFLIRCSEHLFFPLRASYTQLAEDQNLIE